MPSLTLRNRRWYSTQLGARVYVIALDSMSPLTPGSEQAKWLDRQIDGMTQFRRFPGAHTASSAGGRRANASSGRS